MATAHALPTAATPIERILSRFDRHQIEDFIEVAISLLDVANDPDVEPNGDELDQSGDESDWSRPEWRGGRREQALSSRHEQMASSLIGAAGNPEDAEDDDGSEEDDPSGGNSEDEGEAFDDGAEPMAPLTLNPDQDTWLD